MHMQKLDWILDSDDVVIMSLVDQIDDGRQRRTLAAARRPCHQHDSILDIRYFLQLLRQIEIAKARRSHRDNAHDDRVRATLLEDVDAETSIARNAEREISRACFFEAFHCSLLVSN